MRFISTEPERAEATGGSVGTGAGNLRHRIGIWASTGNAGSSGGSSGPSSSGSRLSSSGGASGGGGGGSRSSGAGGGSGGPGGTGSVPPGRPGSGRPGGPAGPERGVSYQPEERYWTDYLRIAFPVLGLLLLLGLFWFWATELIDNNDEPNGTNVAQSTLTAGPSPTTNAGAGTDPALTVETTPDGNPEPTATSEPRATRTARVDAEEPTEEPDNVGQFAQDDIVVTIAEANLRSSPALEDDNVVTTIAAGTEMTVTGASVRADGYIWVPVVDTETGDDKGYMAEENLEASA